MPGILVIRGGAIGDFVLTLPVLRLLRGHFPDARVEVLGSPGIAELALHFGLADDVRRLEDPALARFFVPGAELDEGWSRYFAGFSVIISYLFDPDDYFHSNLARTGKATILRGPHRPIENGPHATLQLAAPLAQLAVFPDDSESPPPRRTHGERENTIVLHPGSGSPRKNWDPAHWARVAADMTLSTGARLLIIGGEAEDGVMPSLLTQLAAESVPVETALQLPLPRLAARLSRCRLFLGHDTGPAHLAAFCGLPSVLVFRSSDPAVWAPIGRHVRVLSDAVDPAGSPSLSPESVTAEVLTHLAQAEVQPN